MQSINSIRPVTLSSSRFSGHRCKHTSLKRKSTRSIRYLRSAFIPACSSPPPPPPPPPPPLRRRRTDEGDDRRRRREREDGSCSGETVHVQSIPSKKFRSRRGGHYSCKALTTSTSSSICVSTRMGIYVAVIRVVTQRRPTNSNCLRSSSPSPWNIRLSGKLSYRFRTNFRKAFFRKLIFYGNFKKLMD